ncbi:hypothetical protein POM88_000210 [Heracleum sosnowskyi]|uniref:Transposase-associated domain-containing protein n=1 Tax=Heracleum sosnowskyi TaxID=360622 RepID=A0AAD8N3T0_9APIA|nr:hypothetical protein POM88_000210 [Heracleum sosnowskyi]
MSSDRSWMRRRHDGKGGISEEYVRGVNSFVEFVQPEKKKHPEGLLKCPCKKCKNQAFMTEDELKWHLLQFGIIEAYITWDLHGEKSNWNAHYTLGTSSNRNTNEDNDEYDVFEMLRDVAGEQDQFENVEEDPNHEASEFYKLAPRQNRNPDLLEAYTHPTSKVGREKQRILTDQELEIVRFYGLINMPEVSKYLEEFEDLAYAKKPRLDPAIFEIYAKKHFISWFERRVRTSSSLRYLL